MKTRWGNNVTQTIFQMLHANWVSSKQALLLMHSWCVHFSTCLQGRQWPGLFSPIPCRPPVFLLSVLGTTSRTKWLHPFGKDTIYGIISQVLWNLLKRLHNHLHHLSSHFLILSTLPAVKIKMFVDNSWLYIKNNFEDMDPLTHRRSSLMECT